MSNVHNTNLVLQEHRNFLQCTAISVDRDFVSGWVSRFGVPSLLTTDRGRQFESRASVEGTDSSVGLHRNTYDSISSFSQWFSGAFPSSNESFIESMRNHHWLDRFFTVSPSNLGLRTALKQDLGCSTAELVYGTSSTLRIPGEFFAPGTDPLTSDPSTYAAQLKLAHHVQI